MHSPDIDASACHIRGHQDVLGPLLQASQSILPAGQIMKCIDTIYRLHRHWGYTSGYVTNYS